MPGTLAMQVYRRFIRTTHQLQEGLDFLVWRNEKADRQMHVIHAQLPGFSSVLSGFGFVQPEVYHSPDSELLQLRQILCSRLTAVIKLRRSFVYPQSLIPVVFGNGTPGCIRPDHSDCKNNQSSISGKFTHRHVVAVRLFHRCSPAEMTQQARAGFRLTYDKTGSACAPPVEVCLSVSPTAEPVVSIWLPTDGRRRGDLPPHAAECPQHRPSRECW